MHKIEPGALTAEQLRIILKEQLIGPLQVTMHFYL